MSVSDRIEDSNLLFAAGRLEGALTSVLIAIAATSRKRYPDKDTIGDRVAFERFLTDERNKITGGKEISIDFCGKTVTLEALLYKFMRNSLLHNAELDDHISVDYGDFLLDKRGTTDYFTFSSELVIRLSFVVATAPENKGLFPEDRFEALPAPTRLRNTAIIRFEHGGQPFEMFGYACSVITETWDETGEQVRWLHVSGQQAFRGQVAQGRQSVRLLVPVAYITNIEVGPAFTVSRKRTSIQVGLFPPGGAVPKDAMNIEEIESKVRDLQIQFVDTVLTLRRPYYG